MTDVVNRSSADESEEKQHTMVKQFESIVYTLQIFNMKSILNRKFSFIVENNVIFLEIIINEC